MARKKKLNEDQPQDNINDSSDDTFGLPEIEYEPLKRDEEKSNPEPEPEPLASTPEPEQSTTYSSYTEQTTTTTESTEAPREEQHIFHSEEERYVPYEEEESPSVWPKVLGIALVILLLGGGAYWYLGIYKPEQDALAEKARLEQEQKEAADKKSVANSKRIV